MFRTGLLRGACAVALVLSLADSSALGATESADHRHWRRQAARRRTRRRSRPVYGDSASRPRHMDANRRRRRSLTVPSVAQQRRELERTVGSVAFVDANTPEIQTRYVHDLRDALKDVPGVYVESRYGQELRLSIRGSNLTRDFHLRGLELLQDGIPMNYADGGGDMYQIDPKYFRAIEVMKGGNALAYGSSTLGGAINFISPTAYTALAPNMASLEGGSYGTVRGQAQMSRIIGNFDFLINGTFTHADNYRKHSTTDYTQLNGNLGYRFSNDLETRFYFGVYDTWQLLPGQLNRVRRAQQSATVAAAVSAGFRTGRLWRQSGAQRQELAHFEQDHDPERNRPHRPQQLVHAQLSLSSDFRGHRTGRRDLGIHAAPHLEFPRRRPPQ